MTNSLPRLFLFALLVSATFADYAITFDSYTARNRGFTTVTTSANGYKIALYQAGWVYGDPIQVSSTTTVTTYATLLSATGQVGIGLIGATCAIPYTAENHNTPTFVGDINGNNGCPADFATVYTGTRPAGTTSSTALTGSALVVNNPVAWIITQPPTTAANQVIGVEVQNWSQATTDPASIVNPVSTAGNQNTGANNAQNYALSTLEYTLYVQTAGTAVVCVQNYAQFTQNPGDCGEAYQIYGHSASSAGILSTSACIFVAFIAFIFYN